MATPQINIINNSDDEHLHIVVYQKSEGAAFHPVAWRVASLSTGSTAYIPIPACYAVQVRFDRAGVSYRSACIPTAGYQGAYHITGEEGCIKVNESTDAPPDRGIAVTADANVEQAVGVCLVLGGDPVYGPDYIHPATRIQFAVRPNFFFLAKVGAGLSNGSFLDSEPLAVTEVAIRPNQIAIVTGDKDSGYSIGIKEGLDSAECGC